MEYEGSLPLTEAAKAEGVLDPAAAGTVAASLEETTAVAVDVKVRVGLTAAGDEMLEPKALLVVQYSGTEVTVTVTAKC